MRKKIIYFFTIIIISFVVVHYFIKKERYYSESVLKKTKKVNPKITNDLFLLSINGSSRATAYGNISKIAFKDSLCFIAWLGVNDKKFTPIISVYNFETKVIETEYEFDESYDNHGVPTISVDNDNKLHLFYYPHISQSIKYRTGRIEVNNNISWKFQKNIGAEYYTYPNSIYNDEMGLFLFGRKTKTIIGPDPLGSYGFIKPLNNSKHRNILTTSYSGYSAFSSRILLNDGKIQMLSRFHEKSNFKYYGGLQAISYIESSDSGRTWSNIGKEYIDYKDNGNYDWENLKFNNLITSTKGNHIIDEGGTIHGSNLYIAGFHNEVHGKPIVYYVKESLEKSELYKAKVSKSGEIWEKQKIKLLQSSRFKSKRITAPSGNLIARDSITILSLVIQDENIERKKSHIANWGHSSNSIILVEKKGENYQIKKEFISSKNCVWFPYMKLYNNQLILIFTEQIVTNNHNNSLDKTNVYLYHISLDSLINSNFETILLN